MGFLEAWTLWLHGGVIDGATIVWGLPLRVWGRAGRLLELPAVLVIVFDIIGPGRLRVWGGSFKRVMPLARLRTLSGNSVKWASAVLRYFRHEILGRGGRKATAAYFEMWKFPTSQWVAFGLGFVFAVIIAVWLHGREPLWLLIPTSFGMWVFGVLVIVPIATVLVLWSVNIVGNLVDLAFVRPLAWTLEHPNLAPVARTVSLLVFLAGFQFDLLAYA